MNLGRALASFGKNAAFKLGSDKAGQRLFDDLRSDDETVRMLAGMFIVKNGRRALPLLREKMANREQLPTVLTMLADIGAPESEADIRAFVDDGDPEVARAALLALDVLRRNLGR